MLVTKANPIVRQVALPVSQMPKIIYDSNQLLLQLFLVININRRFRIKENQSSQSLKQTQETCKHKFATQSYYKIHQPY